METVLLSSGCPEQTLATLHKRWNALDIPLHSEALDYLRNCRKLPEAVVIGYVPKMDDNEDAFEDGGLPAPAMLNQVLEIDPDLPVIVSAGEPHARAIVNLVKLGAYSYVVEPIDKSDDEQVERYTRELELTLNRAVQWRKTILENRRLKQAMDQRSDSPTLVARSAGMERIGRLMAKVAGTPATVLVTGESGTGKELVAKLVHEESKRSGKPFVAINCGALTETLLTSELFGHVKGSFTGADAHRQGMIREAGEGTLFLDEIASISSAAQAMLLRVLEERVARPVGGHAEYPVRCRFIAASNQPLERLVEEGAFREDLYYRLNVFHIDLPPLRSRSEDIPLLAGFFLTRTAKEYDHTIDGIEPAAMDLLESHAWPGNVRELRNVIERAVVMCEGKRITAADLASYLKRRAHTVSIGENQAYADAMRDFETKLLRMALARSSGNLAKTARRLKMKRTTLTYRIKHLDLTTT